MKTNVQLSDAPVAVDGCMHAAVGGMRMLGDGSRCDLAVDGLKSPRLQRLVVLWIKIPHFHIGVFSVLNAVINIGQHVLYAASYQGKHQTLILSFWTCQVCDENVLQELMPWFEIC